MDTGKIALLIFL